MARKQVHVTVKDVDTAQIPDDLVQAALLLTDLEARGVFDDAEQKLKIPRQGGYSAVDLWVAVLTFLSWTGSRGFKTFWKAHASAHSQALAAAAGRKNVPSSSALSRGLAAVQPELLREASSWMLTEAPAVQELLRHPAVLTYDADGQGWHVFDLDPTVTTLRHRALAVGDDLPEPKRRSEETGKPGYPGRKRGDIQFRRLDVQHAGAGVFVHARLFPGNGGGSVDVQPALHDITGLLKRLGHPTSCAIVRMDGEFGGVPTLAACRAEGLPFITRLNRSKLYEDPKVLQRLRDAVWHLVPDSLSGPTRSAIDLGVLTVHPDPKTKRADGSRYEPIDVRIVASIYPRQGKANRGRIVDGWQVELFAVDLPADVWPAPEVVAGFFGRAGQENRFAQEDRELGLDRILSYELAGQEFATLTGLFLLNYQIARGFELDKPPVVRPAPRLRQAVVDERVPPSWPRDPKVMRLLQELPWPTMLSKKPGWRWEPQEGRLWCDEGRELALTTVRASEHASGRTGIIFCRPKGGCEACASREGCLRSAHPEVSKHAEFCVPSTLAEPLRERLALVRGKVEPSVELALRAVQAQPGLHSVQWPLFLPAEARKRFREVFDHATVRIEVQMPPPERPKPRLVASDAADRQHRRQTWRQRNDYNRLADEAVVGIEATGRADLRHLLRVPRPARSRAG